MRSLVLALAAGHAAGHRRLLRSEPAAQAPGAAAAEEGLDLSVADGLWDGGEADERGTDRALVAANASHAGMHIFGLFNTGTNLLVDLMAKNWAPSSLAPFQQGPPGWKHAKPSIYFAEHPEKSPQAQDVAIAMIRDPLSWFTSMWKAPYDLTECLYGVAMVPGAVRPDWATRPCTMTCKNACLDAHAGPQSFASIPQLWNAYTLDYDGATKYGYGAVVVVRYEDLVTQPGVELQRIGAALGVAPHAQVVNQHGPAKSHGNSLGRTQALKKLATKHYLGVYANGDRGKACGALDRQTLHAHSYHDCDGW